MSCYNELPFVVVNNNSVDVKVYDVDLDKYVINESKVYKNVSYVSLDGSKEGRMKTRPYAQYTSIQQRTNKGSAMLKQRPDYFGCTLDERFNSFDKWVEWAETKVGFMCVDDKGNIYQMDKDLMNYPNKNKHYSPDNCVFLPTRLNTRLSVVEKSKNLDTIRGFFNEAFTDYFETLDEDALGKLIDLCGHNYGMNRFKPITEQGVSMRGELAHALTTVTNWKSDVDINQGVSFKDGKYSYSLMRDGKPIGKGGYTCPKECISDLYKARMEFLNNLIEKHSDDITDEWEGRDSCVQEIKSRKEKLEAAFEKMVKGDTKVLKYIPTYF